MPDVNPNILNVAGAALLAMAIGTMGRLFTLHSSRSEMARARRGSLFSWWLVTASVLLAAIVGQGLAVLLFLGVSFVALMEYFVLRAEKIRGGSLKTLAYALVAVSYLWILLAIPVMSFVFLPLAAPVVLGLAGLFGRASQGVMSSVATTYQGLLLTGYAPAFAVLLWTLPPEANPVAGSAGWFLLLLLSTEANDIFQALIGRRIGARQLAPRISPHKTWAGFVGGVLLTAVLSVVLAAWLTPWHPSVALPAGLLIAVAGLLGDLNVSALKRDCGVKDSSDLLPGQGGMLDRIDSLTFTAPLFYGYVLLIHTAT